MDFQCVLVALFKALSEGFRQIKSIAITSTLDKQVFPCGACRQVLAEFNVNMKIYIDKSNKAHDLYDLIPNVFDNKLY